VSDLGFSVHSHYWTVVAPLTIKLISLVGMYGAGAIYKDDCTIQRFIPIYLIVGGTVSLFVNLMGMMESGCRLKDPERERSGVMTFGNTCEGFLGCFMLAWFICGE